MNLLVATILAQVLQSQPNQCMEFDLLPDSEKIIKTLKLKDPGVTYSFKVSNGEALTKVCLVEKENDGDL